MSISRTKMLQVSKCLIGLVQQITMCLFAFPESEANLKIIYRKRGMIYDTKEHL